MLTFWYEFSSPYSYLSAMRIEQLAKSCSISLRWQPFLLGPIFKQKGWQTSPFNIYPEKGDYMVQDLSREAARLNLPFRMPDPFPQNSLLATRVALIGLDEGWGITFSKAVFNRIFGVGKNISTVGDITIILQQIREAQKHAQNQNQLLDPQRLISLAEQQSIKDRLRRITDKAQKLKIFGAPTFTINGSLFWGNDRLEQALDSVSE